MKVDSYVASDFYFDPSKQYHRGWPKRHHPQQQQQYQSDTWVRTVRDSPFRAQEYASRRATKYNFHPVQDPGGRIPRSGDHRKLPTHNPVNQQYYYYYYPQELLADRAGNYSNNNDNYYDDYYYYFNNNNNNLQVGRFDQFDRHYPNMNYTKDRTTSLNDGKYLHHEDEDSVTEDEEEDYCWFAPPKDERQAANSADEGFCSWNSSSERICDTFAAMDYQDPAHSSDVIMNHPDQKFVNNNEVTADTANNHKLLLDDTLWHTSAWSAPRKPLVRSPTSRNTVFDSISSPKDFDSDIWCGYLSSRTGNSNDRLETTMGNGNDRLQPSLPNRAQKVSPYPRSTNAYGRYHKGPFARDARSRSLYDTDNPFALHHHHHHLLMARSDSLDNVFDSTLAGSGGAPQFSRLNYPVREKPNKLDQAIEELVQKKRQNARAILQHHQPPSDVPDLVPRKPSSVLDSSATTSCSSSSSSSETDVNMVGRSFNNFSISSNKQQEILRLLQERRRYLEANIREVLPKCYPETKILNTSRLSGQGGSAANFHQRRPQRYGRRSEIAAWDVQVAEGLVLERVRYDPNWKKRNRIFWTSDELGRIYSNSNDCPKSVPNEIPRSGIVEIGRPLPTISSMTSSSSTSSGESCSTAVSCFEGAEVSSGNPAPSSSRIDDDTDINRNHPVVQEGDAAHHVPGYDKQDNNRGTTPGTTVTGDNKTTGKTGSTKTVSDLFGDFDVYNIETALPTIDWAKMEAHLTRAAKEDDWVNMRKNDREEIRRRLALGSDSEDYYCLVGERASRKPSLSTRLQSGMNLQICFMNDTNSDQDESSQCSSANDGEISPVPSSPTTANTYSSDDDKVKDGDSLSSSKSSDIISMATSEASRISNQTSDSCCASSLNGTKTNAAKRPSFFFAKQRSWRLRSKHKHNHVLDEDDAAKALKAAKEVEDFYTRQARLQAEARLALTQAKEMAKMQMQLEKQKTKKSPIADIIGVEIPDNSYRISRQLLNNMNISQLQVIVNDLHTQIESLSEELVRLLMARDEFNMEQDSMLVDIEDLTRYLGASSDSISSTQQQITSTTSSRISSK